MGGGMMNCITLLQSPSSPLWGIAIAVLLESLHLIQDAGGFHRGCVARGFLRDYLAWIKPRRDIVALFAPLCVVIIFVVPLEMNPNLLLQVLFSASITILVVRLHYRSSSDANRSREE
jgi:hypothetical protein